MRPWRQLESVHRRLLCLYNTYLRSFLVSKLNLLVDDIGMTLRVSCISSSSFKSKSLLLDNCVGLEFIMQLCVEDEERAGTILAVSNK